MCLKELYLIIDAQIQKRKYCSLRGKFCGNLYLFTGAVKANIINYFMHPFKDYVQTKQLCRKSSDKNVTGGNRLLITSMI